MNILDDLPEVAKPEASKFEEAPSEILDYIEMLEVREQALARAGSLLMQMHVFPDIMSSIQKIVREANIKDDQRKAENDRHAEEMHRFDQNTDEPETPEI